MTRFANSVPLLVLIPLPWRRLRDQIYARARSRLRRVTALVRILNRTGYIGFWSAGLVPVLNMIMLWQFS
jgi:hypothetical protein